MTPTTSGQRLVGRPRVVERTLDIEPLEHILLEAGRLFTVQGFRATTTHEIAEAAGLRQASLYHYFSHKEDILAELLDRIADRALEAAAWIDDEPASAPAKLWALAYVDVSNYCSGPYNVALLARLPDVRLPHFAGFWAKSQQLLRSYERLLEAGRGAGVLAFDDLALTGPFLYGIVEGPVDWFDPQRHDRRGVAALTARSVLLSVLADLDSLADFVAEGRDLAARAPHSPSPVGPPTTTSR